MTSDLIFETDHWNIFLAEDQTYLARAVVELKRPCPTLSELTTEEFIDLHHAIKQYEAAVTTAFGATMFNWTCLMNNAYKNTPPNPQVHWHCRPRYQQTVECDGEMFHDPNFGHHYDRSLDRQVGEEVREQIIQILQHSL
jgi:diadenosine tetraphosphate (Ap4A) HIT family hydrolase